MPIVSSEYTYPMVRTTSLKVPLVEDYVTGRLKAVDGISSLNIDVRNTQVHLWNDGTTPYHVEVNEVDDIAPDTIRTNLIPATELVPNGQKIFDIVPTKNYVEITSVSGGGTITAKFNSLMKWDIQGFAKTDTTYPEVLWGVLDPD